MTKKCSETETAIRYFFLYGFDLLRGVNPKDGQPWRWCHVVYSGFNKAFKEYFPEEDPVEASRRMVIAKVIITALSKGGANFKPLPEAFTTPTGAEKEVADQVSTFLLEFVEKKNAKKRANGAGRKILRGNARKEAEARAQELAAKGDFKGAMEILGFPTGKP